MKPILLAILVCLSTSSERLVQKYSLQDNAMSYLSNFARKEKRHLLNLNTTEYCDFKIDGLENEDIYTDKHHPESSLDLAKYIEGSTKGVVFNVSEAGEIPTWIKVDNVHQALLFYPTKHQKGPNSLLLAAQDGSCLDTARFTVNVHYRYNMWERISENVLVGVLVTFGCSVLITLTGSVCYCAKRFGKCCWAHPMQTPSGMVICCLRSKFRPCEAVGLCFECKSCHFIKSVLFFGEGVVCEYNPWRVIKHSDLIDEVWVDAVAKTNKG